MHELLERLVAAGSVSGQEEPAVAVVEEQLAAWGIPSKRSGNNLWFRYGAGRPALLMCSHLDTVPACAGWQRPALPPRWEQGRLYGLGANDAKGCVSAMLATARFLFHERPRLEGSVVFALTAEEETGGQGLATILERLGPLDAAIVGEPTSLEPVTAQRGMLILRCTARGTSAHVAHAARVGAVNAIEVAARDILWLAAWRPEPHPLLGQTLAQVTTIEGGLRRNQVPDSCIFYVDLRTTPNLSHQELPRTLAASLQSEVAVHSARYLPKSTPLDGAIVRAAVAATGRQPLGSATTSDWAFLGSLPAVKLGPGDTRRSHRPDEYLEREELAAGIEVYRRLVLQFLGAPDIVGS